MLLSDYERYRYAASPLIETICQLSARLIVNTAAMKLHRTEILEFIEKCRGALQ